jgi:hypothetical protein
MKMYRAMGAQTKRFGPGAAIGDPSRAARTGLQGRFGAGSGAGGTLTTGLGGARKAPGAAGMADGPADGAKRTWGCGAPGPAGAPGLAGGGALRRRAS